MASKPFEPKGEVARWVPVYERLKNMAIGEIITYEELSELAGVNIRRDRSPFVRAAEELLSKNQRLMKNLLDEGYAVAHPSEQSEVARNQTRKANRRLKTAIKILSNTDNNHLTPQQRRHSEAYLDALSAQSDMMRRLSRRQDRLEKGLKDARQETRAMRRETKETTAELAERLERLEALANRLKASESRAVEEVPV
jgi:hypothetical protein